MLEELGLETRDIGNRDGVQMALGAEEDRDHLLLDRKRAVLRLLEQLHQSGAPFQLRLGGLVQIRGECGEGLQFAVLRKIQTQRAGHLLHRLDLSGTAHAGHRYTDVDGRPHPWLNRSVSRKHWPSVIEMTLVGM